LPTVGETGRAFRDRALGKALILVAVLVAAVLVARSCGKTEAQVSQDQAVAIAREAVDFEANYVQVRLQKRGLKGDEFWLVGLADRAADGSYRVYTSVLVDADTGEIAGITPVRGD
jgi:hypothetical protein